jgi:hypothetical protein
VYFIHITDLLFFSALAASSNNRIQLTVISVTFFAKAKKPPLITAADAGVEQNRYRGSFRAPSLSL